MLLDGGRRTDDAVVDEVVDIVMDAESIQVKGKTINNFEKKWQTSIFGLLSLNHFLKDNFVL